jgi:hypothetical protein
MYPITLFKSFGVCEICKKPANCNETSAKDLPMSVRKKHVKILGKDVNETLHYLLLKKLMAKLSFEVVKEILDELEIKYEVKDADN